MQKGEYIAVDVKLDERLLVHVGARWQRGLEDLRRRSTASRRALNEIASTLELKAGAYHFDLSGRPVRVLPFLCDLSEALAQVCESRDGFTCLVHDGTVGAFALRLQRDGDRVLVSTDGLDAAVHSVACGAFLEALRAAIGELLDDVEQLPPGALLVYALRRFSRAEAVLAASRRPRGVRHARARSAFDDGFALGADEQRPFLVSPSCVLSLGEEPVDLGALSPVGSLSSVRRLSLEPRWDRPCVYRVGPSLMFSDRGALAIVSEEGVEQVSLADGAWVHHRSSPSPECSPRLVDGALACFSRRTFVEGRHR